MPGGVDGEHGVDQLLELHAKGALPPIHGVDALARPDPPGLLERHAGEAPVGLLGLVEREEARDEAEDGDAEGPHVDGRRAVAAAREDLRRAVALGADLFAEEAWG